MPALARSAYSPAFWLANVVNLLCLSGAFSFVLLPLYLERSGLHRWEIGLVAGAFSLVSVFARPWLGRRMDRQGRRRYFVAGALLMSLASLAFAGVPVAVPLMVLLRGLQGLGMALYFTAIWTWMADTAPEGRLAEVLGLFGISGLLAGAAGPVLAENVMEWGGFLAVFAVGGGLMLLAGLLSSRLEDRLPEGSGSDQDGAFWGQAVGPALSSTMLAALAFGLATGTQHAFAAPFVHLSGLSGVGTYFTVYTAASVAVRLFAGRAADRLGAEMIVMPALLCQAAGLAIFSRLGAWGDVELLVVAALVGGCGHGMIYPAMSALSVQRTSAARRGTSLSLFTAVIEIGAFAGATLSGLAAHLTGYPQTFLGVGAVVLLAASAHPLLERRFRPAAGFAVSAE